MAALRSTLSIFETISPDLRKRIAKYLGRLVVSRGEPDLDRMGELLWDLLGLHEPRDSVETKPLVQWINENEAVAWESARLAAKRTAFAENVRRLMAEHGLTQERLAERMGIQQPTLAELISGKYKPQPKTLRRLADVFGCSIDAIWPAEVPETQFDPRPAPFEFADLVSKARSRIACLPEPTRSIVRTFWLEGCSTDETARANHSKRAKVKKELRRGRHELRREGRNAA
jgi:transcriptional regulator with XRE-family HTH domain